MRGESKELLLKSLRILRANGCHYGQSRVSFVQLRRYANERAEDSSTSNWGTGEPPIDEKQTQRGVPRDQTSAMNQNSSKGTAEVGRRDETTSTSNFDSGASSSPGATETPRAGGTKKSRTGSDMSDDGQVCTPHLGKMKSTREMIHDKGRETEERLSRTESKST